MPLPSLGTMTTFDTLLATQQSIVGFGEDRAWDGIASMLNAYNAQVTELTSALMDTTTDRQRRYGSAATMEMQRIDEFGSANAQKVRAGVAAGFPLENWGVALQWTRKFMAINQVKQLAAQVQAATFADMRRLIRNMKLALFQGVNYTFTDYLVDHQDQIPIPIRALLNADGLPIPPGPNAEVWNPLTHTHYLASATLTDAFLTGLINTVLEHYDSGQAVIWINRNDEAAVRALTNFKALDYVTTVPTITLDRAVGALEPVKIYNRLIGYYNGAEVWTKPWMIPTYAFCYMQGQPQPLCMRIRGENVNGGAPQENAGELTLVYEDESHPLRAKAWEREYGIAVWNRTNGAIGYFGGSTYQQPVEF